uniref:Uncharacterized protein n=1 Tax=Anguilla anguilla TaxID=7936 RepID=A0A0E9S7S8_ANGAN
MEVQSIASDSNVVCNTSVDSFYNSNFNFHIKLKFEHVACLLKYSNVDVCIKTV